MTGNENPKVKNYKRTTPCNNRKYEHKFMRTKPKHKSRRMLGQVVEKNEKHVQKGYAHVHIMNGNIK